MDMMNGYDFVNLQKEIMEGNTKEIDGEKVDEFAYYYLKMVSHSMIIRDSRVTTGRMKSIAQLSAITTM